MTETVVDVPARIAEVAQGYRKRLADRFRDRLAEMEGDDTSHYLVYRVLGIKRVEGKLIDEYQNKGRFLYNFAGNFLQDATKLCFQAKYPEALAAKVPNTRGKRPKNFEVDCLVDNDAIEIKWRDATTDGDHITKEHTRIAAIGDAGHVPIRIMYYYPNRDQAKKIQDALRTLYKGASGEYYAGDDAWEYVHKRTGVDLKDVLTKLAEENDPDE